MRHSPVNSFYYFYHFILFCFLVFHWKMKTAIMGEKEVSKSVVFYEEKVQHTC